ncbi:MAG: hypothetical protein AAF480_06030 [Actinomycetota bacterium]
MNVHDRLRRELGDRATTIDVGDAAGADAVIAAGEARLRRARILGAVAATALVVGVGGVALALRDGDDPGEQQALINEDTAPADVVEADPPAEEGAASAASEQTAAADDEEVATTEPDVEEPSDAPAGQTDDAVTDEDTPADEEPQDAEDESAAGDDGTATDDQPRVTTSAGPAVIDTHAHNGGFVGLRAGSQLVFSTDGKSWSAVADPRPDGRGSIVDMASHNGVLYVVGVRGQGANARSWVVASSGLDAWESVDIGEPADDGSDLSVVVYAPTSVAVGGAGVVITGETVVHIDVESLLDDDVYAAGDWTIGTSTGDLSKLVTYDPETGAEDEVIDLVDAGVPTETIALLERPEPFVATGAGRAVSVVEHDLARRTVLTHAAVGGTEFLAAGFSSDFSSRILWSSGDAQAWTAVPVSVIGTSRSDAIGVIDDRVVVFTGDGPLMTVQVRQGGDWTEVRLDDLVGDRNDDFVLADASFGPGGVAAAVLAVDETGNVTAHLVSSTDGLGWRATTVASFAGGTPGVVDVDSVGMGSTGIAVGFERSDGTHETMLVPIALG